MRKHFVLSAALCALLLLCCCGQRATESAPTAMPWPSHAPEATPFVRSREEAKLRHLEEEAREQPSESSWEEMLERIYVYVGKFRFKDWEKEMFEQLPQDEDFSFVVHTPQFLRGRGELADYVELARRFADAGCEAKVKRMDAVQDGVQTIGYVTVVTTTPAHLWELAESMDELLFVEQLYESVDYRFDTVVWPES